MSERDDEVVDETPTPPAEPVRASTVTGPVLTVEVPPRMTWGDYAERGCLLILGAAIGFIIAVGLVAL